MSDPFLKDEEEILLAKMLRIKESIISTIDPDKASAKDKEILLRAAESIENTIFKRTQLRAKKQDTENVTDIKSIVTEILTRYKDDESPSIKADNKDVTVPALPDNMVPKDFVDGELDIGIVNIDYKEIVEDE